MPGKWAAPPAPAIIISRPRPAASDAYDTRSAGVRCADTTLVSNGIPSEVSVSAVDERVSQSDWEPIISPTRADAVLAMGRGYPSSEMPVNRKVLGHGQSGPYA